MINFNGKTTAVIEKWGKEPISRDENIVLSLYITYFFIKIFINLLFVKIYLKFVMYVLM